MTTSNTITQNDFSAIFENIHMATFAYGRGEVGEIKAYGGSTIPAGWLLCDGQAVSRTTYPELFSVIGTTYGSGDGSTTFNVPDLRGRVITGVGTLSGNTYTLGEAVDAGLPNIAGYVIQRSTNYNTGNITWTGGGALSVSNVTSTSDGLSQVNGAIAQKRIDFDASKSNSIYGNSTTVQPNTLAINYIIYAKNTVTMANPSLDLFYPVGSYYETSDSTFDPNVQWGGTWVLETAGQVHVSAGTGYSIDGALTNTTDGGASTVALNVNQMPQHTHGFYWNNNGNGAGPQSATWSIEVFFGNREGSVKDASQGIQYEGGSQAHNNMQPYIVVNRWHRIA